MKIFIPLLAIGILSCTSGDLKKEESLNSTSFFEEIAPVISGNQDFILPKGFSYQVIFQGATDSVIRADGKKFISKKENDMLTFIPIEGSSSHGYLYVGHETFLKNEDLGDGGGGSLLEIEKTNGKWNTIGDIKHIDFSNVGETVRNCGGSMSNHGTILSCEEFQPANNIDLWNNGNSWSDTSDLPNGLRAFENQGWVVEVDPKNGKAMHKLYSMGRFMHEDVHCMPDDKTVFLSDDNDPAVFFKFIADNKGDFTQGQLYAFQQTDEGGNWLEIPRDTIALINARATALQMGATKFIRHEWMDLIGGKLYISETGKDIINWMPTEEMDDKPASHFKQNETGQIIDPYGRILMFDPETNEMKVYLEGGTSKIDSTKNFSNPDCIVKLEKNGRNYLVISEDLIGTTQNRISEQALRSGEKYCEVYILDMSIMNPTVDDLVRFAVAPNQAETTGDCFTPDGKTMFLNIQHPDSGNKAPFNKSTTVAIEGF